MWLICIPLILIFHAELGAEIVHRRKRTSNTCIEIIFYCEDLAVFLVGHLNTLKEAEKCGYFVICRPPFARSPQETSRKTTECNPSKRHNSGNKWSFCRIILGNICKFGIFFVPLHPNWNFNTYETNPFNSFTGSCHVSADLCGFIPRSAE